MGFDALGLVTADLVDLNGQAFQPLSDDSIPGSGIAVRLVALDDDEVTDGLDGHQAGEAEQVGLVLAQADLAGGHTGGQFCALLLLVLENETLHRAGQAVLGTEGTGQERGQATVLKEGQQRTDANTARLLEVQVSGQDLAAEVIQASGGLVEMAQGIRGVNLIATTLPVVEGGRGNLVLGGEDTKGGALWVVQRLVEQTDNLGTLPAERILAGAWQLGGLAGSHGSGPCGYSQSHRTHPTRARSEALVSPTARTLHLRLHNPSLLCQLCKSTFMAR